MKTFIEYATTACAVATLATPAWSETARYDDPVDIDLTFVYHIDADMAEQDVFVAREAGATEVFRATAADRDMGQPLYASAQPQAHSPFDIEALGPYPKGKAVNMTLGEWFGASGSGSYSCKDGAAEIDVAFDGLVPEGVYTMWHFFMAMPPTDPFIGTYDLPLGSRDGSDSVFTAEANGTARFQRSFKPCLQLGGEHLMSGLAIAWHSDGQTYGVEPGEFGLNSHIQLFLGLPPRAGM